MDQFQNPNFSPTPSGSNVPPPPPPPVSIRTMDSDVKSIEQSGGGQPVPQFMNVNREQKAAPVPQDVKITMPGYQGPEEKIFAPETLPAGETLKAGAKGGSKTIIMIAVLALSALGLGFAGYFFVYPVLFPEDQIAVAPPPPPPPPVEAPPPAPLPPPPPPPAVTVVTHTSAVTSDKQQIVLSMSQVTPEAIPTSSPDATVFKEVVLQDAANQQLLFAKYLSSLLPEFAEADLAAVFEDDFTAFVYYDKDGAWPGYVAKVKSSVSLLIAQNVIQKIENFTSLGSLYLQNPGAKSADGWKNGQIGGQSARYTTFALKGSALSYTWIGNQLLISTNYAAAQEAAKRLIKE